MTKRKLLLPSIEGIKAGSTAGTVGTIKCDIGYRYAGIQIVYKDGGSSPTDIKAMFDDILVFKNTKAQRTHTAEELDHLNVINGSQYGRQQINTGVNMRQTLNIYFLEPWRKDKLDADSGAWNVTVADGWKTFQITLKLLADMPATASIIAYALVDDALVIPAGKQQAIKKVYRAQITASGTSIDVTTLDAADAYQVISLKNPSTGYINEVSLKRNKISFLDQVNREDNVAALVNLGMNPANSTSTGAFGYDIVLDADDPVNSSLLAQDQTLWLQLKFSAAAAGNVIALVERVGAAD